MSLLMKLVGRSNGTALFPLGRTSERAQALMKTVGKAHFKGADGMNGVKNGAVVAVPSNNNLSFPSRDQ